MTNKIIALTKSSVKAILWNFLFGGSNEKIKKSYVFIDKPF